jgi:hypothetical protein
MRRTPARKPRKPPDVGLRREYRFDYAKSRPNRFAVAMASDAMTVVLDPDVAAVFDSSKKVNKLLRAVIAAMPRRPKR